MPGGTLCQVQNISTHTTRKAELEVSKTTSIKVVIVISFCIPICKLLEVKKKGCFSLLIFLSRFTELRQDLEQSLLNIV